MSSNPSQAEGRGRAVQVYDGDTFQMDTTSVRVDVRLSRVRAPEKGHPRAAAAQSLLAPLVVGKQLFYRRDATDVYGRWVCEVWYLSTTTNSWVSVNDALRAAGYTDMGR